MSSDDTRPVVRNEDTPRGFAFGLAAYFMWGLLTFYFKAIAHLPSLEVLAHRVIWSVPIAAIVLIALRRTGELKSALGSPRMLGMACVTATLITINWGVYVSAIAAGRALDAALGYFINPIFSVFLAAVFVKEKPTAMQISAIALVAIAVVILTVDAGGLPWVSIAIAISWGCYALFRKTLPIGPNQGFFLEVLLISIPSLPYVIWLEATGQGHFLHSSSWDMFFLAAAGIITAGPLMIYSNGAKLLRLSTVGIMQYIVPTMVFLIAVFVFHEPLSTVKLIAFLFIWAGLIVYTISMLRQLRGR